METGRQRSRTPGNSTSSECSIKLICLDGRLSLQMDRSEWQTRLRIQTYFGLFVEGVQVAGVSSVRTNPCGSRAVALISLASATVRVYPPVSIGASFLSITPNTSQNVTALGIDFISLVAKYQNGWTNTGIAVSFLLFQDKYALVCTLALSVRPAHYSPCTTSRFIGLIATLMCLPSFPFLKS